MKITLRPAETHDEHFLYTVYASTRLEEMALVDWTESQKETFLHMQFDAQRRSYLIQFPTAQHQLILRDGTPIGRMITARSAAEIYIVDIALLPDQRNKRIGTRLLEDLQCEAAREGKALRLHVEFFNPARHLYERLGFTGVRQSGFYFEMEWLPQKEDLDGYLRYVQCGEVHGR